MEESWPAPCHPSLNGNDSTLCSTGEKKATKDFPDTFWESKNAGTRDVICCRNTAAINNPGNMRYNLLVQEHREAYQATRKRSRKISITQSIVQRIQDLGGRFVKYDRKHKVWREISEDDKREKVSHALRSAVDPKKKKRQMYIPLDVEAFDRGEERCDISPSGRRLKRPRKRNPISPTSPDGSRFVSVQKRGNMHPRDTNVTANSVAKGKSPCFTSSPEVQENQDNPHFFTGISSLFSSDFREADNSDDDLSSTISSLLLSEILVDNRDDALSSAISSLIEAEISTRTDEDGDILKDCDVLHANALKQSSDGLDDSSSMESGSIVREVLDIWAGGAF